MNPVALARALYGGALVAAPRRTLAALGGSAGDDGAALAARVLGARHVLQSLAQRSGRFPRAGAIVDALHATSMFALAAADTERRRPALIDGSIAAALSASGFASYRIRRGR